jgi:hypothetical protein
MRLGGQCQACGEVLQRKGAFQQKALYTAQSTTPPAGTKIKVAMSPMTATDFQDDSTVPDLLVAAP